MQRTVRGTAGAREDGAARSPSAAELRIGGCGGGVRPEQGRPQRAPEGDRRRDHHGSARELHGAGCCEDWLTGGLPGRDPKTFAKNKYVLEPVLAVIGAVRLRDLDVTDVDRALAAAAATRSRSTVAMAHLALTRAQAKNLVLRNVSALTGTPPGQQGRPSRSMTLAQATALTAARAAGPRIHAYVMLSLCTGVRTEEARALRWEHFDLGDPASQPAAAAAAAERGGVAVRAGQGRHQDLKVTAHPRAAATGDHWENGTVRTADADIVMTRDIGSVDDGR